MKGPALRLRHRKETWDRDADSANGSTPAYTYLHYTLIEAAD